MFRGRRRVANRRDSRPGNPARVANFTLQKHASTICTRPPPPPPPPQPHSISPPVPTPLHHPERNIVSHTMVAATEVVPLSAPSPVPSDAKTAVVVNGAEKPGSTTTTAATAAAVKSKPKGKNQQRREKRKQKKIQSSRESSVVTESESESVRIHCSTGEREREEGETET